MKPLPHQIEGARFLTQKDFAVLADAPRVGKTGAAIMAADAILAHRILVVTTASGRAVWRKGFADWSVFGRSVEIVTPKALNILPSADVAIIGWPSAANAKLRSEILKMNWDLVIFDEHHYAKNFDAKRTVATYGLPEDDGASLNLRVCLGAVAPRVWNLSGTPMPHSPFDLYPLLRFGAPERLEANAAEGWPDVTRQSDFKHRYCKIRPKKIGHGPYARRIDVIMGGQNLDELRARIDGLMLRRTQEDVGIMPPVYETVPLLVGERARKAAEKATDLEQVIAAIDEGNTRSLDMHLGPLRRLTGEVKARAVAELVRDEFESGLDKIVLAYWHGDVAKVLIEELEKFGVTGIDGSTPGNARSANVEAFSRPDGPRVFLAQIQAAGEAIDLSAASELLFVEMSFTPKDGAQMALRVTNHGQTRQPRVRVASLAGSIDEAIQSRLLMLVQAITEVMK